MPDRLTTLARLRPLLAAACALAALGGCTAEETQAGGGDTRYVEGDGSATAFPPDERDEAPEVSGTTLDGDELSVQDFAGDVVVINFWATWCAPCRAEKPVLDEVYSENAEDGLEFLGVNIKDDESAAQRFAEEFHLAYPSLYDQPGEIPQAFRDTVPPQAIPSTLVIDRDGRIAGRVIGQSDYTTLSDLVEPILDEGAETA
jgi:thiol-disulfide isomerase/thioredoxin